MLRHSIMMTLLLMSTFAFCPHPAHGQAVPKIAGPYVTVYRPASDRFPGPDTRELKAGTDYAEWVPNDQAFILGPDHCWHAFGITHPLTSPENVHDGEQVTLSICLCAAGMASGIANQSKAPTSM